MELLSFIFTTIGIIIIIAAILSSYNNIYFRKNSQQIKADVSNIAISIDNNNKKYKDTLVDYSVDGVEYKNISLGTYINSAEIGSSINIYTRFNNPINIKAYYEPFYMPIFLFVLGALLLISALMANIKIKNRQKEIDYLINNGNKTLARIIEVQLNTSLGYGSKRPRVIVAKSNNDNKLKYYSDNLWIAPDCDIIGCDIDVFVNSKDKNKYYVDIRKYEL